MIPENLKKIMNDGASKSSSPDAYRNAFKLCYETLLGMGGEFDEEAVWPEVKAFAHCYSDDHERTALASYLGGRKDQHSILSAQLAAKDLRIKELEEYKSMYEGLCK